MPRRRKRAAAASGEDRIGALPDPLLLHVLSLLPAVEAVRTCVLARRWRDLWMHTPSLRLVDAKSSRSRSAEDFTRFVNHLMVLRGHAPLAECEISLGPADIDKPCSPCPDVKLWVKYALICQVRVLQVIDRYSYSRILLDGPLISQNLVTLDLKNVNFKCFMDFSSCPKLENLNMKSCDIYAHKISSKSLKRMCITRCFFPHGVRTRISVPSLIFLRLDDCDSRAPLLESMPLLETAFVRLDHKCVDDCDYSDDGNCGQESCRGCCGFGSYQCVLLNGLSNAINLELMTEPSKYIIRRDLALGPIFGRLKTLLLNEWYADLHPLVCVLQCCPILEKLTLQLRNDMLINGIGPEGNHDPVEQSFACPYLKVVNIECKKVNEKVRKILKILNTCGILPEQISIVKSTRHDKFRFSFEKRWQRLLPSPVVPDATPSTTEGE